MADLLKDIYNQAYLSRLVEKVQIYYPDFAGREFVNGVFDSEWANKELKARNLHIAHQLKAFIHLDYAASLSVIEKIAPHFTSYQGMFVPAFVEIYGLNDLIVSTNSLAYITQFASAEFAIRPFIERYPEQMHFILLAWTKSENEHIRRLASEGSRPRLPWAMALPAFKKDPSYLLPILENLKYDTSEYVRRSVANNLNDIAKDHPQCVINICRRWLAEDNSVNTSRLVKHACRSLLKQAMPDALSLFGFLPPTDLLVVDLFADPQVKLGESLQFSCRVQHQHQQPLDKLRIEFAIDFMKKNGQKARKIFQLSESLIKKDNKMIIKSFSFKTISTRQYYCGSHSLAILINGVEMNKIDFILHN